MRKILLLGFGLLVCATWACSGPGFSGRKSSGSSPSTSPPSSTPPSTTPSSTSPSNDELQNKHPDETGKPSEDTEGVPGYLIDPDMVNVGVSGNQITISGDSDSVKRPEGAVMTVVSVSVVTPEEFDAAKKSGKAAFKAVGSAMMGGNGFGSFSLSFSAKTGEVVLVSVGGALSTDEVRLPKAGEGLTSIMAGIFDGTTLPFEPLHAAP